MVVAAGTAGVLRTAGTVVRVVRSRCVGLIRCGAEATWVAGLRSSKAEFHAQRQAAAVYRLLGAELTDGIKDPLSELLALGKEALARKQICREMLGGLSVADLPGDARRVVGASLQVGR